MKKINRRIRGLHRPGTPARRNPSGDPKAGWQLRAGKPLIAPYREFNGNLIARNGWETIQVVTDMPPFNAVIGVKASMATAGDDGHWTVKRGMVYFLAELKGVAAPD